MPIRDWKTISRPKAPVDWEWDTTVPCRLLDAGGTESIMIDPLDGCLVGADAFDGVAPDVLRALCQRATSLELPGWT